MKHVATARANKVYEVTEKWEDRTSLRSRLNNVTHVASESPQTKIKTLHHFLVSMSRSASYVVAHIHHIHASIHQKIQRNQKQEKAKTKNRISNKTKEEVEEEGGKNNFFEISKQVKQKQNKKKNLPRP